MLSVYYVDAVNGNDSWSGLAGAYTSGTTGPWQTVAKVNASSFHPGDSVLFQRGETWRDQIAVKSSGSAGDPITYGAYGNPAAAQPLFLGSSQQDNVTNWTNLGGNIWTTTPAVNLVTTSGSQLLPNPSFTSNTNNWTFYASSPAVASGAATTTSGQWDSSPAGYKVYNVTNNGSGADSIQLYTGKLSITSGNYYLLTFRAKCTSSFSLGPIMLQENASPYTTYATETTSPTITTSWATYSVLFQANTTATNARLNFYLGSLIPVGSTFYLDTLSLYACALPTASVRRVCCTRMLAISSSTAANRAGGR